MFYNILNRFQEMSNVEGGDSEHMMWLNCAKNIRNVDKLSSTNVIVTNAIFIFYM